LLRLGHLVTFGDTKNIVSLALLFSYYRHQVSQQKNCIISIRRLTSSAALWSSVSYFFIHHQPLLFELNSLDVVSSFFNAHMLIVQDLKTRSRTWLSTRDGKNLSVRPGVVVMKFGEQLRSSVIQEYQWYYIDYDGLKNELKGPTGPLKAGKGPEWTEDDETRFVERLESELDKVHTKQKVKAMEISRRIAVSEREVKDVVNRLNERGLGENGPSEEEFMLLEEDLSDIIADVHDLAKFVQLNYTGFYKIIKKHDVRLKPLETTQRLPNESSRKRPDGT
jgi:hypothetical protein